MIPCPYIKVDTEPLMENHGNSERGMYEKNRDRQINRDACNGKS